jgi:hypothetical protein
MLYEVNSFKNYSICGIDGTIGKVKELLFDDQKWTVRYLVADTGSWLIGRKVLIAPEFLVSVNKEGQCITVNLTKQQVEDSPPLSSDKPVDRQYDRAYWSFFSLPESALVRRSVANAFMDDLDRKSLEERYAEERSWDHQLRSSQATTGYAVEALDGDVGCIADLIVDDQTWVIRYMIVNTSGWWPGHQVLVAPPWINKINWGSSKIFVSIDREPFKNLEAFTSIDMLTREYEARLHKSCNRQGYWTDDPACSTDP